MNKLRRKIFCFVLFLFFNFYSLTSAGNIYIQYFENNENLPIFVERNDGSMVVFKLNSAHLSKKFQPQSGGSVIAVTGFEIEPSMEYTTHEYSIWCDRGEYTVFYPKTPRFPNGENFYVENPYQIKVCRIVEISAKLNH